MTLWQRQLIIECGSVVGGLEPVWRVIPNPALIGSSETWPPLRINRSPTYFSVNIHLWPVVAASVLACGVWYWRDGRRRFGPGNCHKCGYDLAGNVSGRCPECGASVGAKPR